MVTKEMFKNALIDLGVEKGMVLEVHTSLSSFGELEDGAETVINTLKEIVTEEGSIFMPALRLSPELPLSEEDKELGITVKIKVLPLGSDRTAMGIVADTFRKLPDTYTGQEVISTSGWGKHGKEALTGGLDYPIHNGGKALMLGVDIYKLTAMHYVEGITPEDINNKFKPTDEINRKYPPDEWFIEAGHPPVKAWYKIQEMAYEKGLIRETAIGDCKVMFFDIWSVISLYENELKRDPYGLWGMDGLRRNEMNTNDYTIRLEKKEDYRAVENLVRESFWNVYRPGCSEHYVIHVLRDDPAFVKDLDFVMEKDGKIIGQNMFMKTIIEADDGRTIPVLTMGPIGIIPELKRKGYGKAILDYSLEKATGMGFGAVLFEGNIDFYGKCGFDYASKFGIRYHDLPEDADASFFLCKELIPGYLDDVTGVYQTPQGYYVDDADVDEFDKEFPPKEKLKLPGQIFG